MDFDLQTELLPLVEPAGGAILVDFSWLLHKSFYTNTDLSVTVGGVNVHTGAMYGSLRSVTALLERRPDYVVILCVDGKSEKRLQICPDYKGGRADTDKREIYGLQGETLAVASLFPGVYVSYHPDFEADDLIWTFSQAMKRVGPVLIYANDKDLTQCLADGDPDVGSHPVQMFSKMKKGGFQDPRGEEYVLDQFGVDPESVAMFRAIRGDKSDNLPGYFRFPSKLAVNIASLFDNPEDFLAAEETMLSRCWETDAQKKRVMGIIEDPSTLRRNYFVMKLQTVPDPMVAKVRGGLDLMDKYALSDAGKKYAKFRGIRERQTDGDVQA